MGGGRRLEKYAIGFFTCSGPFKSDIIGTISVNVLFSGVLINEVS